MMLVFAIQQQEITEGLCQNTGVGVRQRRGKGEKSQSEQSRTSVGTGGAWIVLQEKLKLLKACLCVLVNVHQCLAWPKSE